MVPTRSIAAEGSYWQGENLPGAAVLQMQRAVSAGTGQLNGPTLWSAAVAHGTAGHWKLPQGTARKPRATCCATQYARPLRIAASRQRRDHTALLPLANPPAQRHRGSCTPEHAHSNPLPCVAHASAHKLYRAAVAHPTSHSGTFISSQRNAAVTTPHQHAVRVSCVHSSSPWS